MSQSSGVTSGAVAARHVKVLGPGCARCRTTAERVQAVADRLGVAVQIEKITDYAEIARCGVMSTPGVIIDGQLRHAGGLPSESAIADWLAT